MSDFRDESAKCRSASSQLTELSKLQSLLPGMAAADFRRALERALFEIDAAADWFDSFDSIDEADQGDDEEGGTDFPAHGVYSAREVTP
jgi:hypothetical protein